jgi:hypothetical protein
VFASVAKLARKEWLARLDGQAFDYVVVDEVHHATARSYREILGVLRPSFLLGLTATPDRADAADVLGLFDDFVAYRADISRGVAVGRLVPFHYFGVKDDIQYAQIPWRNGRFDPEELARAAQTEQRMQTLWRAWGEHPGARTLIFCCSVAHVDYVAAWLLGRGVRVAKVYSAPGSDDRDVALERLASGDLDAVCAIRPTESGVVFLQQLGRGLRASGDKAALTVVDFVGNHRIFLERLRTLLSLGDRHASAALHVLIDEGHVDLPAGCSVDLELEAKALLEALFRVGGADEVERAYRELRDLRDVRPSAAELLERGYRVDVLRRRHQSWFAWVRSEGDLSDDALRAYDVDGPFLDDLEVTTPTRRAFHSPISPPAPGRSSPARPSSWPTSPRPTAPAGRATGAATPSPRGRPRGSSVEPGSVSTATASSPPFPSTPPSRRSSASSWTTASRSTDVDATRALRPRVSRVASCGTSATRS